MVGQGPISSTSYIRKIVQVCFDRAIARLREDKFHDEEDS